LSYGTKSISWLLPALRERILTVLSANYLQVEGRPRKSLGSISASLIGPTFISLNFIESNLNGKY